MQHHAADHLHIEVAHPDHAPSSLAHHGEGLRQNRVERRLLRGSSPLRPRTFGSMSFDCVGDARAKLLGLLAQLFVGEGLISASSALICATVGSRRFIARSLVVPKTFAMALLIKTDVLLAGTQNAA